MTRFLIFLSLATAIIVGTTYWFEHAKVIDVLPSFMWKTILSLFLSTAIIFFYLTKRASPDTFVQLYLLSMVLKLFAYLGYNIYMFMQDKAGAQANVVLFMCAYFVYTFLEVASLYYFIDRKS